VVAVKNSILAVALVLSACGSRSIPEEGSEIAACPVCAPPSFTCRNAVPNQESATMTIAASDADSCTASLGYTMLELRCKESQICEGSSCVPFSFEGTTLVFQYGAAKVSCSSAR
jgi:hypothetical protein